MASNSTAGKRRLFNVVIIGVIVVAAFAAKPARVFYHRSAMQNAWRSTFQHGGTNSQDLVHFETHRDALVKLGYFARETLPLPGIKPGSPEQRALTDSLNEHASKAGGYFSVQSSDASTPPMAVVWAIPAQMDEWRKIIQSRTSSPKQ